MDSLTELDERAEYIAGLRALADVLEANEVIPLPWEGRAGSHFTFMFAGWRYGTDDQIKEAMTASRRAIGGTWEKDADTAYFNLERDLRGVRLQLTAERDVVCTRVVVGTHEETKQKPVQYESVTEIVEDVEWVCEPMLDSVSS